MPREPEPTVNEASDAVGGGWEAIMRGVIAVQQANFDDMVADPDGPYPACKNRLGTYLCDRCGRDVRGTIDACPLVPREKRWRFRLAGEAVGGRDSAFERNGAQGYTRNPATADHEPSDFTSDVRGCSLR